MSRILGVDISDISTTLAYYNEEKIYKYPTIICKERIMIDGRSAKKHMNVYLRVQALFRINYLP